MLVEIGMLQVAVYLCFSIALVYGLLRRQRLQPLPDPLPRVSVIVAAKNEARDLPDCLRALAALTYPTDRLQVILVDDHSTDATRQIMAEAAEADARFTVVDVGDMYPELTAKARALAAGADHADGAWLFVTDADSRVPPRWIQGMLACADARTGVIGGPFVAQPQGMAGGIEMATTACLMAVPFGMSGITGLGLALGPNMALRRDLYVEAGGLAAQPPEIAEDMALMKIALKQGYVCRGVANPDTLVRVAPVGSIRGELEQQKRWIIGGMHDAPLRIKLIVVAVALVAWLVSFVTLFGWLDDPVAWSGVVIGRVGTDALLALALGRRTGVRGLVKWFPAMWVYFVLGYFILPIWIAMQPRARWRGDGYDLTLG